MCSLSVVLFVFVNRMMALWEQHFLLPLFPLTDKKGSTEGLFLFLRIVNI